jgi:hypothetical protein
VHVRLAVSSCFSESLFLRRHLCDFSHLCARVFIIGGDEMHVKTAQHLGPIYKIRIKFIIIPTHPIRTSRPRWNLQKKNAPQYKFREVAWITAMWFQSFLDSFPFLCLDLYFSDVNGMVDIPLGEEDGVFSGLKNAISRLCVKIALSLLQRLSF